MGNDKDFQLKRQVLKPSSNICPKAGRVSFLLLTSMLVAGCNTMMASGDEVEDAPVSEAVKTSSVTVEQEEADKAAKSQDKSSDSSKEAVTDAAPPKPVNLDGDMLFNLLAAEFAGNTGDVEASLSYYQKASETIEDSRIAARSAYIAIYGENYKEALSALDRWQELEPDASELPRMYAVTYLHLHEPAKAVPYINQLLEGAHASSSEEAMAIKQLLAKDSNTQDSYVVLSLLNGKSSVANDGNVEAGTAQADTTQADMAQASTTQPNKHLLVLQSRYAAELKHYDEALTLLDDVLIIDPKLTEVLILKARILTTQGKHEDAAVLVKKVVDEYPDNDALRLQYARMLVEQRKLPEATEQYELLYEKLPDGDGVGFSLALIYIETKKLDEATEVLEHLIELDKRTLVSNYYLGRIAQNRGEDKQAVSYYLKVSSGDYHFDSQLRVGVLLAVLGKPDEGLVKLEVLAEGQTSWELRVKSYLAQGEILRSLQRYKEGVEMYSRALQQKRDDTNLLYARGLMAEKVDRLDITEADLLQVINKEPKNANALNALGYTLADRTARYAEALEYIKRAAELVPDDPAILDSLGWVSFRLGKMDDAIKWLSKAFEKLEDAEIAAHYGEVLWNNNQKDKAREVWGKGKQQNDKNPVLIETLDRIKP